MNENNQDQNANIETKKPISNLLKFGLPAVIIIAIIGAVFATSLFNTKDPAKLLAMAYIKSSNLKEMDASFDMKMDMITDSEDPADTEIAELIKHINISGDIKGNFKSTDSFALSESIVYNYDDIELMTLNLFMDNNQLALNVPTFLEKWVFADYDKTVQLAAEYTGMDLQFSVKDYYKLFTTEDIADYDKIMLEYGTFLMDRIKDLLVLGEKTTVTSKGSTPVDYECDQIILTLNADQYYKIYFELLDKMISDSRLETIVKTKLDSAIEISKENGVLDLMTITDEDIAEFNATFSTEYATAITTLKEEMNYDTLVADLESAGMNDSNFEFIFYIDSDKNLRGLKEDLVINTMPTPELNGLSTMKISLNMVYNSMENVVVDAPDYDNAYDITVDPETTAMTIMFEVQSKLATYLDERPQIETLFNSLQ